MSNLLGNICLFLAALVSSTLISSVYNYKPPLGGSGGAEAFPIWVLLLHVAILFTLGVAMFAIAANGGFDWIPINKYGRYVLLTVYLLLATITSLLSALMMNKSDSVPVWLGVFLQYGYIVVPVVLIAAGFVLNNSFLRATVPPALYQWPLAAVLGLSLMMVGAGIWESLNEKSTKEKDQDYESKAAIISMRLQEIADADITHDMVRMLEFSRSIYPTEVYEKSAEKIMSHPNWQQELIGLLETDQARGVLYFLASNDAADKKLFSEPVRKGLSSVAALIRHDIQGTSPSAFSKDMFSEDVECALIVVEKFGHGGTGFLPEIQEIRAALDEPVGGKIMKFDCREVLDNWLQ